MKATVRTHVGVVRSENQDKAAVFKDENAIFAILCDGMGGHFGGLYAASITIDIFQKEFEKGVKPGKEQDWFGETIKKAKKEMIRFAQKDEKLMDMGTTLTAALILKDKMIIFNIGDSRTYVFNGLLHPLTKDHNLRNYYIDHLKYSPEEAAKITGATALTSALGPKKSSTIDVRLLMKKDNDNKFVILTSDGIHDYISKPVFETIMSDRNKTIEEKGDLLIEKAIRGKSSDNLTCAIVDLEGWW